VKPPAVLDRDFKSIKSFPERFVVSPGPGR
jgi:hypothetical protein